MSGDDEDHDGDGDEVMRIEHLNRAELKTQLECQVTMVMEE